MKVIMNFSFQSAILCTSFITTYSPEFLHVPWCHEFNNKQQTNTIIIIMKPQFKVFCLCFIQVGQLKVKLYIKMVTYKHSYDYNVQFTFIVIEYQHLRVIAVN